VGEERWTDVDRYIDDLLIGHDEPLERALTVSSDAGLPAIQVAPNQGKLLWLLAKVQGAQSILEIGTLGGYSTIWLARALPPDGHLVTLEAEAKHADVARANVAAAGLHEVVEIRLGPALETLSRLATEGAGPFDVVFIDADKPSTTEYFEWAVRLARPGTLIIVDNFVRDGAVADPASSDPDVRGMRRFAHAVTAEPRVSATAIQTVGTKGYDGFVFAVVLG
jgi:predicted O-methyltransferase YrrM